MDARTFYSVIRWLLRKIYMENIKSTELYFQAIIGDGFGVF
jgi:hypothetical protein